MALLALLATSVAAALVEGTVYDLFTLEPANAVVEANSTPRQVAVAHNGSYALELPPGAYRLVAKSFRREGDTLVLVGEAEENLTIASTGRFHVDLILTPLLEEVPVLQAPEPPAFNSTELQQAAEEAAPAPAMPWLAIVALLILFVAGYWYYRSRSKGSSAPVLSPIQGEARPLAPPTVKEVSEDERRAMEVLGQNDGRLGQKELRKLLGWSEAKASLVVTGLEDKGVVRRIRKGRGNIVRLEAPIASAPVERPSV